MLTGLLTIQCLKEMCWEAAKLEHLKSTHRMAGHPWAGNNSDVGFSGCLHVHIVA